MGEGSREGKIPRMYLNGELTSKPKPTPLRGLQVYFQGECGEAGEAEKKGPFATVGCTFGNWLSSIVEGGEARPITGRNSSARIGFGKGLVDDTELNFW